LIQETARQLGGIIADEEMFKTFNMGWGFAIIVDKSDVERALNVLNENNAEAEQIGQVKRGQGVKILYKNRAILLG
jgi:phosphoribosylformylglycinamidine cyclo-ligase